MTTTKSYSDLAKLDWYLNALRNAKTDPKMSESLQQIGVSAEVLEEGSNLHNIANKAYSDSYAARKKRSEAYEVFSEKSEALDEHFKIDIKKARIALISDELAQKKLELNRTFHKNRLKQFDISNTFYTALSKNPDLLEPLAKLGLQAEDVTARLEIVSEIGIAKADYMLEKGNSQNATNVKNKAMAKLSKWMTQFFSISKNAFKEEPQMLEALGIVIKN
jgi:hypothetical protein